MLGPASDSGQLAAVSDIRCGSGSAKSGATMLSRTDNRLSFCALSVPVPCVTTTMNPATLDTKAVLLWRRNSRPILLKLQNAIRKRAAELYQQGGARRGSRRRRIGIKPKPKSCAKSAAHLPSPRRRDQCRREWYTPANTILPPPTATCPANGSPEIAFRFALRATNSSFAVPMAANWKPPS